ncbi:MAG: ABC transporter ATP-binding protein [Raineya sp.]|nr:ABC transporter ATP-binding protein/permease [Raineya sp.]MDW8296228.1 ABC transporter ATP-binding protein [Raineya sp.]
MKTYLRIFTLVGSVHKFVIAFLVTSLLASLFGLVNFTMIIPVLEILFQNKPEPITQAPTFQLNVAYFVQLFKYFQAKIYYEEGAISLLWKVCLIVLASVFLTNVFRYLTIRTLEAMKVHIVTQLRKILFEKTLALHLGYFTEQRKGNLLARMSTDISEIEHSASSAFKAILREPFLLIFYFTALFYISWQLTLFVLIYIPIVGSFIGLLLYQLRKKSRLAQEALGSVMSLLDEVLGAMRIVKAFNAENFVNKKFNDENNRYKRLVRSIVFRAELASPFSEFMGVALISGVILYGGTLILSGSSNLQASEFLGFLAILSQVTQPIKEIVAMFSLVQRGIAASERIFQVMDTPSEIQDKPNAQILPSFKDKIVFENVNFAYRNKQWVLKNINFTIPKGKMIALVGASGSGKSTIADLLCRFYEVQEGGIFIDGYNIKEVTMHSLRSQMGIVSQEAILFNDTVFNNIAFGTNASLEDVMQAAKIAHAHEFIEKLPQGYYTNIGERGSQLSGGQRQRISIARAVLRNPPILILDEATSALDNESEKIVQQALNELMQERTALVIAHRLSTIQKADEILVLDKGEIVERGTHQELISTPNSLYAKLYKSAQIVEDIPEIITESRIV